MKSFSVNKYMFNERNLFIIFYALYLSLVKIKLKEIMLHTSHSHFIIFYTVDNMSSQQQQKKWNIPDEMAPFISEKCPNGNYLVCSVCSMFDIDERKFGLVKMRNHFWLGYYNNYLKSMRHKDNCLKKANHEEANKRRRLNGERPQKRMRQ